MQVKQSLHNPSSVLPMKGKKKNLRKLCVCLLRSSRLLAEGTWYLGSLGGDGDGNWGKLGKAVAWWTLHLLCHSVIQGFLCVALCSDSDWQVNYLMYHQ